MTPSNLADMFAATADLSLDDYSRFHSYLLGILSAQVDAETWQRALDASAAFVERSASVTFVADIPAPPWTEFQHGYLSRRAAS